MAASYWSGEGKPHPQLSQMATLAEWYPEVGGMEGMRGSHPAVPCQTQSVPVLHHHCGDQDHQCPPRETYN